MCDMLVVHTRVATAASLFDRNALRVLQISVVRAALWSLLKAARSGCELIANGSQRSTDAVQATLHPHSIGLAIADAARRRRGGLGGHHSY